MFSFFEEKMILYTENIKRLETVDQILMKILISKREEEQGFG